MTRKDAAASSADRTRQDQQTDKAREKDGLDRSANRATGADTASTDRTRRPAGKTDQHGQSGRAASGAAETGQEHPSLVAAGTDSQQTINALEEAIALLAATKNPIPAETSIPTETEAREQATGMIPVSSAPPGSDRSDTLPVRKNIPAATLDALLAQVKGGKETPVITPGSPADQPSIGQRQAPAQATEIVIENWQARFSYQTETVQAITQPVLADAGEVTGHGSGPESALRQFQTSPRDANASFIHSQLPSVSTDGTGKDPQSMGEQQQNDNDQPMAQGPKPANPTAATADNQPDISFLFAPGQDSGSSTTQAVQETTIGLTLRLPSGLEIPHSHILNQVVHRLTGQRALESGTVTLRLHPAELGELRMEIRVEQDNIKAHITTQNPQVQEILDQHLPRLREALQQQGMSLAQMTVSLSTEQDGSQPFFQDHFDRQQMRQSHHAIGRISRPFEVDQDEDEELLSGSGDPANLNVVA